MRKRVDPKKGKKTLEKEDRGGDGLCNLPRDRVILFQKTMRKQKGRGILKHLSEIALIATVSFAGELLNHLLPLPVPGSIYGLVLMLILLVSGIFRVDWVKGVGDWLISIMPVMFVGPVVGLIGSYNSYKDFIIPLFIISALTTVITMAAAGLTAQGLIRMKEGKGEKNNAE